MPLREILTDMCNIGTTDKILVQAAGTIYRCQNFTCETEIIARLSHCIIDMLILQPKPVSVAPTRVRASIYELRRQLDNPRFTSPSGDSDFTIIDPLMRDINEQASHVDRRRVCYHMLRLLASLIANSDVERLSATPTEAIMREAQTLGEIFERRSVDKD